MYKLIKTFVRTNGRKMRKMFSQSNKYMLNKI